MEAEGVVNFTARFLANDAAAVVEAAERFGGNHAASLRRYILRLHVLTQAHAGVSSPAGVERDKSEPALLQEPDAVPSTAEMTSLWARTRDVFAHPAFLQPMMVPGVLNLTPQSVQQLASCVSMLHDDLVQNSALMGAVGHSIFNVLCPGPAYDAFMQAPGGSNALSELVRVCVCVLRDPRTSFTFSGLYQEFDGMLGLISVIHRALNHGNADVARTTRAVAYSAGMVCVCACVCAGSYAVAPHPGAANDALRVRTLETYTQLLVYMASAPGLAQGDVRRAAATCARVCECMIRATARVGLYNEALHLLVCNLCAKLSALPECRVFGTYLLGKSEAVLAHGHDADLTLIQGAAARVNTAMAAVEVWLMEHGLGPWALPRLPMDESSALVRVCVSVCVCGLLLALALLVLYVAWSARFRTTYLRF